MTDAQTVTLAVAILAVFAGTIFNNSRISDVEQSLSRHIDDKFNLLSQQMKHMEDNIMRIVDDLETRAHRLGNPKER